MGTKCYPSYVNIFMGIFEEKFIYPLVNNITRLYLRFIDDILIIWTGTLEQLLEFKQRINKVHPSIKFNLKFWNKKINILDTVVYKTAIGKLKLNCIRKTPTDRSVSSRLRAYAPYPSLIRALRACAPARFTNY